MSFLNKIKGTAWGKRPQEAEADVALADMTGAPEADDVNLSANGTITLDMNAVPSVSNDSSIISEAAPSELTNEFSETRVQQGEALDSTLSTRP